jgi:hypothetical protein
MKPTFTLLTTLLLAPLTALNAAEPKAAAEFSAPDKGFLKKYCLDCHAGKSAQRDFDLEALQARPADGNALEAWVRVYERVRAGEMPPADADRPSDD